jgi:hypothetical protein
VPDLAWQDVRVQLRRGGPGGGTSRRAFLGALGAVAASTLAGCDLLGGGSEPAPPHPLTGFVSSTIALAALYDVTVAAHPDLTAILTPVRAAHRQHIDALITAIGTTLTTPTPPAAKVPAPPQQAIATLAAAERKGRDDAVAACLANVARLAPLLGSIAAARASHLEVLV